MDVGWDYKLDDGQRDNPVVFATSVELPDGIVFPNEYALRAAFKTDEFKKNSSRLKAWGRKKDKSGKTVFEDDPHWIAVRNGTPLHMDPPYPRYSHHLKIRVDEGIFVRGLSREELKLTRGTFYILDTHSPHQVFNKAKFDGWNVAVSIDSYNILPADDAIERCVNFALSHDFTTGAPVENF
mgnify:CR=1 FL=1